MPDASDENRVGGVSLIKTPAACSLHSGFMESGLALYDLWLLQIAVGGTTSLLELDAIVNDCLHPSWIQHETIAVALNEYLADRGDARAVSYWHQPVGA
jgi:hypothetical protein